MKIKNPFSPGRTVDPQFFAGREKEIKRFLSYLKSTKDGNPMNLAVLGERGIGKSSLLRKYEKIAKEQKCITVRLDLDSSFDSINTLSTFILNEIKKEGQAYSKLFSASQKIKNFFRDYKIEIDILGTGLEIEKINSPASSLVFRDELSKIWESIKDTVPAIIIMMDEAEELERIKGGALQVLRNVFSRLSEQSCGYMVVISGKLALFSKIKKIHSPLARFFNPITLVEFNKEESLDALNKPLTESPFDITEQVKETIVEVSEGHPYIIQLFGYYLCENAASPTLDKKTYDACFPLVLDGLASQLFSDYYSSLSQMEQQTLKLIAQEDEKIVTSAMIAKKENRKPQEITPFFDRLHKKDCLKKPSRGKYQLFHGLFREYLKNI